MCPCLSLLNRDNNLNKKLVDQIIHWVGYPIVIGIEIFTSFNHNVLPKNLKQKGSKFQDFIIYIYKLSCFDSVSHLYLKVPNGKMGSYGCRMYCLIFQHLPHSCVYRPVLKFDVPIFLDLMIMALIYCTVR